MVRSDVIEHIPPPLLQALVEGRWLPFIGAGFSLNAEVPSGAKPPTWRQLGEALARDLGLAAEDSSPIELLSAYEQSYSRAQLVNRVSSVLRVHDATPGPAHDAFARVPFDHVVTTNFDFLLESAHERAGRRCMPVILESQLLSPNPYPGPIVLKMHGDLNHPDDLVVTEDDYDAFLVRKALFATSVSALLVSRTTVLIGYSLDDPDTRQILAMIRSRLNRADLPIWTIQSNPRPETIARYERRGVRVISLPKPRGQETFGAQLTQLFTELWQYWDRAIAQTSEATDDRISADLRMSESDSRMCLFSVPLSATSWYADVVFPLVEDAGYIPVTFQDVVSPGDSLVAKMESLVRRCALMVVEIGPDQSNYGLGSAISQRRPDTVLLVASARGRASTSASLDRVVLVRPDELEADPEGFVASFRRWLSEVSRPLDQIQEAERLLGNGEYWAALLAAVAGLEFGLRKVLSDYKTGSVRAGAPSSMRTLLKTADDLGMFENASERDQVERAVTQRNMVLHESAVVSRTFAQAAVGTISRFSRRNDLPTRSS